MYKKVNVVMLPNNEKAILGLYPNSNELIITHDKLASIPKYQHLYILSDEKPKERDWCINPITKLPFQVKTIERNRLVYPEGSKKIIATTDSSLYIQVSKWFRADDWGGKEFLTTNVNLPQPLQSFIEYFVTEYNKGNIITEVMVEYEEIVGDEPFRTHLGFKLKINPENTINIKI